MNGIKYGRLSNYNVVNSVKISEMAINLLQCPACSGKLRMQAFLECIECHRTYPVVDGVPILIYEENSVFRIEEITKVKKKSSSGSLQYVKTSLKKRVPSISANWVAEGNFRKMNRLLRQNVDCPLVLVLGSGDKGEGVDVLANDGPVDLVATDVYLGGDIGLVCDAHDIPFEDLCFDGVVIQAVLEHVVDPWSCVSEIYRVLKLNGIVYAETPFMQQVHMGCYDFARFTYLGHRRLFRHFGEIESRMNGGPGMALAWAYEYFLTSFFQHKPLRGIARVFARFTSFWLKYFDKYLLNDTCGAMDAALGYYFLGYKTDSILHDRDLLELYRGVL